MAAVHRPRCFLEVSHAPEPLGRLTVELFADKTPKTCENFRQLCTGEHEGLTYARSSFHRVIDEFMIQGGDIANGDGTGTVSIYNGEFEDENLNWRDLDAAGLVCSANRGKNTNGSQFFITLEPCEHLNGKHTIFGRLVCGEDVLQKIAAVEVDENDRPVEPVLISRCGELEKRKKTVASQPPIAAKQPASGLDTRGRKRSNDSDDEMKDSPEPAKTLKTRRQSDNVIDEGLRGRPRQRTRSRSASRRLSTPSQGRSSEQQSPVQRHKRKRSKSPSRHVNREDGEQRRRRSLPNQYREDEKRYRPGPRHDDHQRRAHGHGDSHRSRRDDGRSDRYRPRDRRHDDGRLGGASGRLGNVAYDEADPPVKFKGRGVMKYREPGRL